VEYLNTAATVFVVQSVKLRCNNLLCIWIIRTWKCSRA